MLSSMYKPRLLLNPTANVPTMIVRMVSKVRDLLPQKSAQIFFQRLVIMELLAKQYFAAHFDLRFGLASLAWIRIDSINHPVDRSRGREPPRIRFQQRVQTRA